MPRISHSHESYQSKPPRSKWGTVLARYDRTGALIAWQVRAYRNFCGALDWFSLSVGGVGVSRGGVEFVPVDAGPVCGRDAVVRFGRRCLFALPQGVGDE